MGNDGYDMNGQYYLSFARNKSLLLSKIGNGIKNKIDTLNTFNVTSLPEFLTAIYVITSEIFGLNTDWYLKEKRWYEKEMEYEMDRLDHVFSKMDETFEDLDGTLDFHLEANGPLKFSHLNLDLYFDHLFSRFSVFEDTFDKPMNEQFDKYIDEEFDKLKNKKEDTKHIKHDKINEPSKLKAAKKNDFFSDFHTIHQFPKIINWTSSHSGSFSFHG